MPVISTKTPSSKLNAHPLKTPITLVGNNAKPQKNITELIKIGIPASQFSRNQWPTGYKKTNSVAVPRIGKKADTIAIGVSLPNSFILLFNFKNTI